uniref:Uncharacterized protein n=1 Tax=Triticum urartu TaxID=4572 RepID=A0A8R7TJ65_TRIUA
MILDLNFSLSAAHIVVWSWYSKRKRCLNFFWASYMKSMKSGHNVT